MLNTLNNMTEIFEAWADKRDELRRDYETIQDVHLNIENIKISEIYTFLAEFD